MCLSPFAYHVGRGGPENGETCQNIVNLLKLGCTVKVFTEDASSHGKGWEGI